MGCQHDDHRVGTRKMLGAAIVANSLIATFGHAGGAATLTAKPVAQMPIKHAFGLRQYCQFRIGHVACRSQRAQIFKHPHAPKGPVIFRVAQAADIGGKERFTAPVDA